MISVYQQHHAPHFPCRRLCHIRLHLPCRSQSGHQDAITAYFDSAGREVTVFPCPNFDSFIADTSLMYRGMLFITNLPRYIIPAGIQILEANIYITSPHFDWLPNPPNLLSFQPSSRSTYTSRNSPSQRSRSLLSHQDSFVGRRPDPDRINSYPLHHSNPHAPVQNIHMGGNLASHGGSCGGMSPLTFWNSGSVAGRALERTLASHGGSYGGMSPLTFQNSGSVAGGASIASLRPMGGVGGASVVPLEIFSTSAMVSPAPAFVNLAQPDTSSVLGRRCPSHYVAGRHSRISPTKTSGSKPRKSSTPDFVTLHSFPVPAPKSFSQQKPTPLAALGERRLSTIMSSPQSPTSLSRNPGLAERGSR